MCVCAHTRVCICFACMYVQKRMSHPWPLELKTVDPPCWVLGIDLGSSRKSSQYSKSSPHSLKAASLLKTELYLSVGNKVKF